MTNTSEQVTGLLVTDCRDCGTTSTSLRGQCCNCGSQRTSLRQLGEE